MSSNEELCSIEWRDAEEQQQQFSDQRGTRQRLSTGISPSSFHSQPETKVKLHVSCHPKTRNRVASVNSQINQTLSNVLSAASQRVKCIQYQENVNAEKIRRAAFRDALSPANRNIKLFGLQTDAFQDFDVRLKEHLRHVSENDIDSSRQFSACLAWELTNCTKTQTMDEDAPETEQQREKEDNVLLEDASSVSSVDEPKRHRSQSSDQEGGSTQWTLPQPCDQASPAKSSQRHIFRVEFERERALGIVEMGRDDLFLPPLWSMEPRLFAKEISSSGKRKYVVTCYGRFADYYWRKCVPTGRHYYELIREDTPCRLYFDLEFCKQSNPELAASEILSETLMSELIEEICSELQSTFSGVLGDSKLSRSHFVDLDSSTDTKFSRHVIVHLPNNMLFANTTHVGTLVKNLIARLAEEGGTGILRSRRPVLEKYLFVNTLAPKNKAQCNGSSTQEAQGGVNLPPDENESKALNAAISLTPLRDADETSVQQQKQPTITSTSDFTTKKSCFVDLGVYTRNRLFRLLGSSKYGKSPSAALRVADSNAFPFSGFSNDKFYAPYQKKAVSDDDGKGIRSKEHAENVEVSSWTCACLETTLGDVVSRNIAYPSVDSL